MSSWNLPKADDRIYKDSIGPSGLQNDTTIMSKTVTNIEDHLKIVQAKSFSELIFELLSEREASSEELKLFELILNISIDHGPDTPSAKKVIEGAQKGEGMSESIAEGIEEIGDVHGGAAQPLMVELYKINKKETTIPDLVKEYLDFEKKIPGFGHRIYKDEDPRAQLILKNIQDQSFVELLKEIQQEIEKQTAKKLVINIDGAIAAALCSMDFDPKIGIAVFIIARTPGLIGQYLNNIP